MSKKDVPGGVKRIPLSGKDTWKPIHEIRSLVFFVVRATLDETRLRTSLDTLVRQHYRILGARIRPTGKGKNLEYHLPDAFPEDGYALFSWSSRAVDERLEDGKLLAGHDDPKGVVTFGPSILEVEEAWRPKDWPVERKFEKPDCPIMLVHLTKYTDATVIAASIPHCVVDQMGFGLIIKSWLTLVAGQTPPPLSLIDEATLAGADDLTESELYRKGVYRLTTKKDRVRSILGFVPELVRQRDEDRRTLFLAAPLVERLRVKYNAALQAEGREDVVLTNGDVIVGVLLKLGNLHRKKPKSFLLNGSINARGRHPALPHGASYLHNAIVYNAITIPSLSRATRALDIALAQRVSLQEQATPAFVDRSLAVSRHMQRLGYAIHVVEPGGLSYAVTNWTGAWRGIDFAPAVARADGELVTNGDKDHATINGTASSPPSPSSTTLPIVFGHALIRSVGITRFNTQIMSKAEGGYWCDWSCSTKNIPLVEKLLETDPFLDTI